jgi:DNA polymerase (family 10)
LALQTIKRRFGVLGIDVEIINQKENFCGLFVGGVPVNLYLATREYWGAMLLYLTGPEGFNRKISSEAKKQGYRLGRYGLFFGKDRVAGKTEEQIFDALGLEYVLPEDRSSGKGKKPLEEKEEK